MLRSTRILASAVVATLVFGGCVKEIKPKNQTGSCTFVYNETAVLDGGWTKVMDEEFDGDLSKWNVLYGGAYNNERQLYQESNMELVDGILKINAKRETVDGPVTSGSGSSKTFNFTSGRIESKEYYSSSATTPMVRMVARIQLPHGKGMWPAFWCYGNSWPTNGEIDILENHGSHTNLYTTNYFYGTQSGVNLVTGATSRIEPAESLMSCYHVYELIWTQNKLSFYLDGVVVDEKTGGYIAQLYGKQQKVTVNLAVGGDYVDNDDGDGIKLRDSEIQPGTMLVDWVKVYTK